MFFTSMGHSHNDGFYSEPCGGVDDLLHSWYQNLTALETETFLGRPFLGQEILEPVKQCSLLNNIRNYIHEKNKYPYFFFLLNQLFDSEVVTKSVQQLGISNNKQTIKY